MPVDDRQLFRGNGPCEYCGVWSRDRDPAHIFHRGMGGSDRLNFRRNLVSLCRDCHNRHGHEIKQLLAIAAKRERCTVEEIEEEVFRARGKRCRS